jgi:hypothetical protein
MKGGELLVQMTVLSASQEQLYSMELVIDFWKQNLVQFVVSNSQRRHTKALDVSLQTCTLRGAKRTERKLEPVLSMILQLMSSIHLETTDFENGTILMNFEWFSPTTYETTSSIQDTASARQSPVLHRYEQYDSFTL